MVAGMRDKNLKVLAVFSQRRTYLETFVRFKDEMLTAIASLNEVVERLGQMRVSVVVSDDS